MRYLTELILQLLRILQVHIFHNNHGKCAHSILIHQNILPLYGFQVFRQITEQIVVNSCFSHTYYGWNQQKDSQQQYENPVSGYPLTRFDQRNHPLFCLFLVFISTFIIYENDQ